MPNLKAIRDRIQSVKNTKKITEAMRLVAAAKVRRAQEQVLSTRPFADALAQVLYNLQNRLSFAETELPLFEQREVQTVALLVISGDRGLCGGYNVNVIKRAEKRAKELQSQGVAVKLVIVGSKAKQYFGRRDYDVAATFANLEQIPNASEAAEVADSLVALFVSAAVDRV